MVGDADMASMYECGILNRKRDYALFTAVDVGANARLRLVQLISIIFATFMYSGGREGKRAVRTGWRESRQGGEGVRGGEVARSLNGVLGRAEGARSEKGCVDRVGSRA